MAKTSSLQADFSKGRRATDRYLPLLALGFAGYVVLGKSFAYLGIPPLFMGEMLFCLGLLALIASGCLTALLSTAPALLTAALMGWVLFRTLQGIGPYGIDALRDGAVALYAGFAFIVAALLLERPARLAQIMGYFRLHARVLIPIAIVGIIVARFAGSAMPRLPGQDVGIISIRSGELAAHLCGAVVLALVGLCNVGRLWLATALLGGVLVASQSRGGMLALIIPITFGMAMTGQLRRLVTICGVIALVLAVAYAGNLSVEIQGNDRAINARALVDNMASIVMPNDANNLDGTKQWRLKWWEAIRNYTFHGPYFWTGKGFGVNLAEADGFIVGVELGGPVLRSPHSVHMTYLARGGVPGLVLWVLAWASWMAVLLVAARQARFRGDRDWSRFFIFLVCYLAAIIIDASFDVALEGPMLGIPFWILFGVGLGALMIYRGLNAVTDAGRHRPATMARSRITACILLLGGIGLNGPPAEAGTCPERSVRIPVGTPIQVAVNAAAPGTTFCIEAGLHREQRVAPKDGQIFIGLPGAVMSGAERLTEFSQQGAFWVAKVSDLPMRPFGTCLKSRPDCNRPMRFFLDDQPLEPVSKLADLRPAAVFHDAMSGKAYFADDPHGHIIERTKRAHAFWSSGARNVVVRGLIVEKYATPAQQGAIFGDEDPRASGWLIENNEVRLNSGAGIATGDKTIVRGNRIHHNGQLGISPNGVDVVIEDNEIYDNNIYGFDASWEAGGVKAGKIERLTLRRNRVHGNHGSGLWCDVDCRDVLIEDNIVEGNADAGIFYEISFDAVIRNNIVRLNGTGSGGQQGSVWFWGAGIQIAASQGVQTYGNTVVVAQGSAGIMLIDQARQRSANPPRFYRTADNLVRDNIVIYEGSGGMSGGASDVAASSPNFGIIETGGNRFDGNTYILQPFADPVPATFIWGHEPVSYDAFRRLGQESRGSLVQKR